MKQKTENKKIVSKLLAGRISLKERIQLNESPEVGQAIHKMWQSVSDENADKQKEDRILSAVLQTIRKPDNRNIQRKVNRTLLVASVILFLISGVSSYLLLTKEEKQMNWYVVNTGRQSMDSLVLSDGTHVVLNAGSRLTYPQQFEGKERSVSLSGQAFFRVAPDKEHPFVVKTRQMDVTALGTAFEVFSFDTDQKVETILLNGKVKVDTKGEGNVSLSHILEPNQMLTYHKGIVAVDAVDANNYSSWRLKGGLNFKNEKLSMILPRLEKWFGQEIECSEKAADYYRFTFTVRNEPLDLILKYMLHSEPTLDCKLNSNGMYELTKK